LAFIGEEGGGGGGERRRTGAEPPSACPSHGNIFGVEIRCTAHAVAVSIEVIRACVCVCICVCVCVDSELACLYRTGGSDYDELGAVVTIV
jgi:hypothetical protein